MTQEKQRCQNCGADLHGEYCSTCGQHSIELKVPLKDLMKELVEELFSFDSRLLHSFLPFLIRPGILTVEFVAGRRTRYISPFKMYFFMSFVYFFGTALVQEPASTQTAKNPVNVDSLLAGAKIDSIVTVRTSRGTKFSFANGDTGRIERKFGHRFAAGLKKLKADPQMFYDKLHEHAPQIVFLLLPAFALLLKLMYIRSDAYYIQHIVFSFYLHSYIFFVLLVISLLNASSWEIVADGADFLYFAIPVNLYLGMRRVYRQSRSKTFVKFILLGVSYSCVLIGALAAAVFILISFL